MNLSVLTTKNDPDYFRLTKTKFEINKSYMDFIQKTLNYLEQKSLRKIALFLSEHPYNEEMYQALQRNLPPNFTLHLVNRFPAKEYDFRSEILKTKKDNFDTFAVFLDNGQMATFFKQMKQLNIHTPTFGHNIMESKSEVIAANGAMDGAIFSNVKVNPKFQNQYYKKFGNTSQLSFGVVAYELAINLGKIASRYDQISSAELLKILTSLPKQEGYASSYKFVNHPKFGKQFEFPIGMKVIKGEDFKDLD